MQGAHPRPAAPGQVPALPGMPQGMPQMPNLSAPRQNSGDPATSSAPAGMPPFWSQLPESMQNAANAIGFGAGVPLNVTSESVAALAAQAAMLATQLREIEARAALQALHAYIPNQPGAPGAAPGAPGAPGAPSAAGAANLPPGSAAQGIPHHIPIQGAGAPPVSMPQEQPRNGEGGVPAHPVGVPSMPSGMPPGMSPNYMLEQQQRFMMGSNSFAQPPQGAAAGGDAGAKGGKQDNASKLVTGLVRRKNDRDKKRRKRGRIGGLLRELDQCLPSLPRPRSVNEVLAHAVTAIRERVQGTAVTADGEKAGVAGGGEGSAPRQIVLGTASIRDGLFSHKAAGVALLNSDLTILNANAVMRDIVQTREVPSNVDASVQGGPEDPLHGVNMRKFIHAADAQQLLLAARHVCEVNLKNESLRRFVVGLRFSTRGKEGEEAERAGGAEWETLPCELVPCALHLYGHIFMLFVFPVQAARPRCVLDAIEALGSAFTSVSDFRPLEMADEVDENGDFKIAEIHKDRDPFMCLVNMSMQIPRVEQFEKEVESVDPAAARMVKLLKRILKQMEEDDKSKADGEGGGAAAGRRKLAERCQAMCSNSEFDVQIQLRRMSETEMEMRMVVGEVIVWQMDLQELATGEVRCRPNSAIHEKIDLGLRAVLLETGDLWFHQTQFMTLPTTDRQSMFVNALLARTSDGGLCIRKYDIIDDQTYSHTRWYRKEGRPSESAERFSSFCKTLQLFYAWSASGSFGQAPAQAAANPDRGGSASGTESDDGPPPSLTPEPSGNLQELFRMPSTDWGGENKMGALVSDKVDDQMPWTPLPSTPGD